MTLLKLPEDPRQDIVRRVREMADKADWCHLKIHERTALYSQWVNDPTVGGALSKLGVGGPDSVRVFLKDTVIKQYLKEKRPVLKDLLKQMGLDCKRVIKKFEKPEALLCDGGRLYTLAVAKEWRVAVFSAFERAHDLGGVKENLVFFTDHDIDRYTDKSYKTLIESGAEKLDVKIHWIR